VEAHVKPWKIFDARMCSFNFKNLNVERKPRPNRAEILHLPGQHEKIAYTVTLSLKTIWAKSVTAAPHCELWA
jgi:hypothetical protein